MASYDHVMNKKSIPEHFSLFTYLKSILFLFVVCTTGFIVLNTYSVMTRQKNNTLIPSTPKNAPANILTGIHLTHYYKEQKIFSIQAKEASIKNKKIGFFRIGGLKQLELENMIVDYFEPHKKSSDLEQPMVAEKESFDLISHFSRASHSLPVLKNKITGFAARHATIRYHHPNGLLTVFNAPHMEINKDRESLQFQKNVAVHFKKKILLCKNLNFEVKHARIKTNEKYTLINNGSIQKGKGLCMNLRLEMTTIIEN
jgi:hypothetical protein